MSRLGRWMLVSLMLGLVLCIVEGVFVCRFSEKVNCFLLRLLKITVVWSIMICMCVRCDDVCNGV